MDRFRPIPLPLGEGGAKRRVKVECSTNPEIMDRKLDELLFALMQNMMITVSGEKLARDLNVAHSTLTRWVDKLRQAGIEIHGELFTGYRLVRLPDVLLPQLIRPRLRTRILGRNLYHFYDVDSTNLFAGRLIA